MITKMKKHMLIICTTLSMLRSLVGTYHVPLTASTTIQDDVPSQEATTEQTNEVTTAGY